VELDEDLTGKVLTGGKLDIAAAVKAARDLLPKDVDAEPSEVARQAVVNWG